MVKEWKNRSRFKIYLNNMSREFKFRAWNKENKKMILPYENVGEDELMISFSGRLITIENNNACGADDCCGPNENYVSESDHKCYEIMQYTGLKDRTGKDIYEGDILSLNYFEGEVVKMWIEYLDTLPYCCTIIKYSEDDWVPLGRIMKRDGEQFTCEVIGNIYENEDIISG
jgi:uncharacterized phage protein (TIGR01671 family)